MKKGKKQFFNKIIFIAIFGFLFTCIMYVKADSSGNMSIDSYADTAWTDYTYYGKNNPTISYSKTSGSGTFYTILQNKGWFGWKNIKKSNLVDFSNYSNIITTFSGVNPGDYRFATKWQSGELGMSYYTYSF